MNRTAFGRKPLQSQRPRVDRFIMPRESFPEIHRRMSWHAEAKNETVDIWNVKHRQQKKYQTYLDDVFGLPHLKTSEEDARPNLGEGIQIWPCAPRKKAYLSSADSILDLPTYGFAAFPDLIDWSSSNYLVAALGKHYHMFSWKAQCVIGKGLTSYKIQCCKFDPTGELLLVGTDMKRVELHNITWTLWAGNGHCPCSKTIPCSITAVSWSPTGNSFVAGCSRGAVNIFDRSGIFMNTWRGLPQPILAAKVSPDTRYVAIATLNSRFIHILVWPNLVYHSTLDSNWIVKTITWHPWRSALLGIGAVADFQTIITFWDAPSARIRRVKLTENHYIIDTMLFSDRTGELVLSLWNAERASVHRACNQLLVMSDPYTVVDQSGEARGGQDRVRTMVFSPDGTKLATATTDEDLIIWNFLPENRKKTKYNSRKFSNLPVYIDMVTKGFILR